MNGYKQIFDTSIYHFNNIVKTEDISTLFNNFRRIYQIYGFIDNGDKPADKEAIAISKSIDNELFHKYYEYIINKKIIGYGNYLPINAKFSQLDSKHVMMSIILFSNVKDNINNILEIGGGYGGWLHLNNNIQNFKKWYILDLAHLTLLQEWYLSKQEIDADKYKLFSNDNYSELLNIKYDLILGTHSLSEFSIENFNEYYEKLVKNTKYLFYSYHKSLPNIELINFKINIIEQNFNLIINVISENGNVYNCLYINKLFSNS
jgi:hypothetical protein